MKQIKDVVWSYIHSPIYLICPHDKNIEGKLQEFEDELNKLGVKKFGEIGFTDQEIDEITAIFADEIFQEPITPRENWGNWENDKKFLEKLFIDVMNEFIAYKKVNNSILFSTNTLQAPAEPGVSRLLASAAAKPTINAASVSYSSRSVTNESLLSPKALLDMEDTLKGLSKFYANYDTSTHQNIRDAFNNMNRKIDEILKRVNILKVGENPQLLSAHAEYFISELNNITSLLETIKPNFFAIHQRALNRIKLHLGSESPPSPLLPSVNTKSSFFSIDNINAKKTGTLTPVTDKLPATILHETTLTDFLNLLSNPRNSPIDITSHLTAYLIGNDIKLVDEELKKKCIGAIVELGIQTLNQDVGESVLLIYSRSNLRPFLIEVLAQSLNEKELITNHYVTTTLPAVLTASGPIKMFLSKEDLLSLKDQIAEKAGDLTPKEVNPLISSGRSGAPSKNNK